MEGAEAWDEVLALYQRVERGEQFELSADVRHLLQRVAPELGLPESEAKSAPLTAAGAETLVREMRRRIFEGSRRLSRALVDSSRRQRSGDLAGAREVLESVLAVEVVPHYRRQAEIALEALENPDG